MTEEQIKAMLNGIINNGEKWEYRPKGYYCSEEQKYVDEQCDYDACAHTCRDNCYSDWRPYKLGDEIHADWEYRKVKTWYVYGEMGLEPFISTEDRNSGTKLFEGTKEECEKWIEEHTKKSWFEDYLKLFPKSGQKETCRIVCKEVCIKILKEVKKSNNILGSIVYKDVEDIIKDLGIEL